MFRNIIHESFFTELIIDTISRFHQTIRVENKDVS